MKKGVSLVLVLAMCLTLCACGKSKAVAEVEGLISAIGEVSLDSKSAIDSVQKAFDALTEDEKVKVENYSVLVESQNSLKQLEELERQRLEELEKQRQIEEQEKAEFAHGKEAYNQIKAAWKIADQFGGDLYSIWHGSVWKKDEMGDKGIQFFVDETTLSENEVIEGLAARSYVNGQYKESGVTWIELNEDFKQKYREGTTELFEKASKNRQCVAMDDALGGVVNAYLLNGKYHSAQESIKTAKSAMKELSEDYEHYSNLKGFYTTTSALIEFCASPSGSLNQYSALLNDYRKEARDYMNELDFVFE